MTTRREFLQTTLAAGAAAAFTSPLLASLPRSPLARKVQPMNLLILGGTQFLGPHLVEIAKKHGHRVTLFNRGITEVRKQTPIDADEKLVGDRDPNVGEGLKALEGREFDAVIDHSGYYPRIVKASAELLAPRTKQYVFISTVSVYERNDTPGADEDAALATMPDPTSEDMQGGRYYGALKALCEQAAEAALPGRVTNIRPGLIVGPGDPTDRFTYWPVRFGYAGKEGWGRQILIPGEEADPVQFIDVRSLAAFILRCVENNTTGVFNALGPVQPLTFGEFARTGQRASGVDSELVRVPWEFLLKNGTGPGMQPGAVQLALPANGDYAGFHARSIARAVAAGLTSVPVADTVRDTLAWWPIEVERRARVTQHLFAEADAAGKPRPPLGDPTKLRVGLNPEQEAKLLERWQEENKGQG